MRNNVENTKNSNAKINFWCPSGMIPVNFLEENTCNIGDKVKVMETRPLSKDKRWRLVEVMERVK